MVAPGLDKDEEILLERFLDALWMEYGLSDHTLAAYRADLKGVALFLRRQSKTLTTAQRADLLGYLTKTVWIGRDCDYPRLPGPFLFFVFFL